MLIGQLGFAMKGATIDALAQSRVLLALAWRRWLLKIHRRSSIAFPRTAGIGAKLPPLITGERLEGQIRLLRSNPLRLGTQPSLTLYGL
jgi:hypothetical protein